jgi:hypothetical protein
MSNQLYNFAQKDNLSKFIHAFSNNETPIDIRITIIDTFIQFGKSLSLRRHLLKKHLLAPFIEVALGIVE